MEFTVLEKMHFTTPEVKPKFARPRYVKDYEIDFKSVPLLIFPMTYRKSKGKNSVYI